MGSVATGAAQREPPGALRSARRIIVPSCKRLRTSSCNTASPTRPPGVTSFAQTLSPSLVCELHSRPPTLLPLPRHCAVADADAVRPRRDGKHLSRLKARGSKRARCTGGASAGKYSTEVLRFNGNTDFIVVSAKSLMEMAGLNLDSRNDSPFVAEGYSAPSYR